MANENFFEKIRSKFFSSPKAGNAPTHSERIQRAEEYVAIYEQWVHSQRAEEILTRLLHFWHYKWQGAEDLQEFQVLKSEQSNGFYFHIDTFFRKGEADFLLDLLRDRVLQKEYYLYTSDRRYIEKSQTVEQRDRHYLKPVINHPGALRLPQRYGNVRIELVHHNNQPNYLRFMANVYAGNNYEEPADFRELAEYVLSPASA